jgi:hypothetical protein
MYGIPNMVALSLAALLGIIGPACSTSRPL